MSADPSVSPADTPQIVMESDPACPACGGDGWYVGHEEECWATGDCNCSGVQIQCECGGRPDA